MEGYTGVSGWVQAVDSQQDAFGVLLCGVYRPALCEGYARKVKGARFYSVSATQDCFACVVSRTCPEVKTTDPPELANYFYYQMDNPVAGQGSARTHPAVMRRRRRRLLHASVFKPLSQPMSDCI